MKTEKIIPTMLSRWKQNWIKQELHYRIGEILQQFVLYLLIILSLTAAAGATAYYILPSNIAMAVILFLAFNNLILLAIITVVTFDINTIMFKIEKIEEYTDPSQVQQFLAALDAFEKKNGLS
jgi:hypothetical protein